jgi:hypothetical protein
MRADLLIGCSPLCHLCRAPVGFDADHEQVVFYPKYRFQRDCPPVVVAYPRSLLRACAYERRERIRLEFPRHVFCRRTRPYGMQAERATMIPNVTCEVCSCYFPERKSRRIGRRALAPGL